MQAMAIGRGQKSGSDSPLPEDAVRALEDREPGPVRRRRIEGDVIPFATTFTQSSSRPIMSEQTGLNRLVSACRLVAPEAALDGFADGDRLGDAECDSGVDDHTASRRFLEGSQAGGGGRDFTWMFGRAC